MLQGPLSGRPRYLKAEWPKVRIQNKPSILSFETKIIKDNKKRFHSS